MNQAEVAALFSHPLNGFLRDSDPPFPLATEPEMLEMKYHTFVDYSSNTIPGKLRTHYFLTGREAGGTKPIFGLTACVPSVISPLPLLPIPFLPLSLPLLLHLLVFVHSKR